MQSPLSRRGHPTLFHPLFGFRYCSHLNCPSAKKETAAQWPSRLLWGIPKGIGDTLTNLLEQRLSCDPILQPLRRQCFFCHSTWRHAPPPCLQPLPSHSLREPATCCRLRCRMGGAPLAVQTGDRTPARFVDLTGRFYGKRRNNGTGSDPRDT